MKLSFFIFFISFSQFSIAESVYRWVDNQGNTHFSQQKPYQYQTKKIIIPSSKIDSNAAKERLHKQLNSFKKRREDSKLRKDQGQKAVDNKDKLTAYCERIASNLSLLNAGGPVKQESADAFMTEKQRSQTLTNLKLKQAASCK